VPLRLVGSEMCIRDRIDSYPQINPQLCIHLSPM
jgi:hypothetical protein